MKNYYELKYTYAGREATMRFPYDVNLEELEENIRDFLLEAGWSKGLIAQLFNELADEEQGK